MARVPTIEMNGEEIVLYFDVEQSGIDAQTFGNSLIAFDELYRAINSILNPGLEVDIDFIRSEEGSIRAILKSARADTKTMLEAPFLYIIYPFLLAVFVNYLTSDSVKIIVDNESYIVEKGGERIVLPKNPQVSPKEAEKKIQKIEKDVTVRRSAKKLISVVDSDTNIKSIDFRSARFPRRPVLPIDRDKFPIIHGLPDLVLTSPPKQREERHYKQNVVVVTAVLERSARRWQFLWNATRVSADIQDDGFFSKLASHEYEFGQGDILVVDLVIDQELNDIVGAYENKAYHVEKVHSHRKGPKQASLPLDNSPRR